MQPNNNPPIGTKIRVVNIKYQPIGEWHTLFQGNIYDKIWLYICKDVDDETEVLYKSSKEL